ncbi:MAG: peptidylprolyl isomerase [Myxococcales bacterium]|nr:peptidylprolyl isomerase [Myxococcales bacterium]
MFARLTALFALCLAASCTRSGPPTPAATPATAPAAAPAAPAEPDFTAVLRDPSKAVHKAPDLFTVRLETTKGNIDLEVNRKWAPNGADRFYNLVQAGYYTDVAFFRVISGFMAQVGLHGDPKLTRIWREANLPDDPVVEHNTRGMVSFATAGPNTRTTQFFINFNDNRQLDQMGFSPFAKVTDASMAVVDKLFAGYGEGAPGGAGPSQGRIQGEGNAYLKRDFPNLDYIVKASVISP